ncbi:MAG: glycosyltransferase family 2 protein [Candidatus Peribacteraceae bacterium]|nr:glycosyltransferase family 2 protein [Candidatus Peribacteraceae bacterium]
MTPLVSVLVPLYKTDPAYLQQALQGLLAQTLEDWECVLVHQPAPGYPEPKKDTFPDPRFKIFTSNATSIGTNWNACLPHAQGEFVQFLFQDDFWDAGYLARMVEALRAAPTAALATARRRYHYEGEVPNRPFYEEVLAAQAELPAGLYPGREFLVRWLNRDLRPNLIGEPIFTMLRRSTVEAVGPFHEGFFQLIDSEYWIRCLEHGDWFLANETLGTFRVHDEGTSAKNAREGKGLFERIALIERLAGAKDKAVRAAAKASLKRSLAQMVDRFVARRKAGCVVAAKGGGNLPMLALRHPVLTLRALWTAASRFLS